MKLTKDTVEEINELLKDVDIPTFRKHVTEAGDNVKWLKRILRKKEVPDRLKELLDIK